MLIQEERRVVLEERRLSGRQRDGLTFSLCSHSFLLVSLAAEGEEEKKIKCGGPRTLFNELF